MPLPTTQQPAAATTTEGDGVIYALATGPVAGAIAVLRVSGQGCGDMLRHLCGALPPARMASLRSVRWRGELLDEALVLWFPSPRSYTGEDSFELHLHASPAIMARVAEALEGLGARQAEAGEFTRRAVMAGRMDILQAEAIADLVAAETESQRQQALRQKEGVLGQLYERWTEQIKSLLASQEALIDFADEELPPETEQRLQQALHALASEMDAHLSNPLGRLTREGLHVVLAGPPNAGKSSLLNALTGDDTAIVTAVPGTTRDLLHADIVIEGMKVRLTDTAGLRTTTDMVEAEGVKRAKHALEGADLVLRLVPPQAAQHKGSQVEAAEDGDNHFPPERTIMVMSKSDLRPAAPPPPPHALSISTVTPGGLEGLKQCLAQRVRALGAQHQASALLTRARHQAGIQAAKTHLLQAASAPLPELRAEELRMGMEAIGRVTGRVGVEDVLDSVFSSFCIGK
ncbi:tRNA uridine-5-carboxymethylaminomethyl(34) synthesis GTPase MnmE [Formicincola oecophyllae]|uniref:tRNA modification GTPase MnmE n=1 Tax=Formicincola oecophyllae TaxID=2558361 RepID=A0A4Y6U7U6_9PROT|nr:tRNA uridine-5-carboxymethylaminomethyl(34) synthesis GTPase MnmE [Formicincola oecophyllae]QDH13503.1 tRNA uridine-5-carboxymethylaminomethyl(34) synthesis GTPase MnmE [Formicincola oecophyllae]